MTNMRHHKNRLGCSYTRVVSHGAMVLHGRDVSWCLESIDQILLTELLQRLSRWKKLNWRSIWLIELINLSLLNNLGVNILLIKYCLWLHLSFKK